MPRKEKGKLHLVTGRQLLGNLTKTQLIDEVVLLRAALAGADRSPPSQSDLSDQDLPASAREFKLLPAESVAGSTDSHFPGGHGAFRKAFRENGDRYRQLFENMKDAFFLAEPVYDSAGRPVDWRFLDANAAYGMLTGLPLERIVGSLNSELSPDAEPLWIETVARVAETGEPVAVEFFSEDSGRWYAVRYFSPCPGLAAMMASDMTRRKKTEERLRESEERLARKLAAARRLQEISTRFFGEEEPEKLYEQILDAAVAIMRSDFASMQMLHPGAGTGGELRLLAFRGFNAQAAKHWERVGTDSQSTCGIALGTGRRTVVPDVEKCGSLECSEDLKAYLQTGIRAVQSTPLLSRTGKMVGMISTHWREPHEPTDTDLDLLDVLARQAADLIERNQTDEALRKAKSELERRVQERTEELQRAYDTLLAETRQRQRVEEQLVQAQKMEAIGTLAGGIAHDFNNMLAVILGNAELALDEVGEREDVGHQIGQILKASKRARDLVKQILMFSRKGRQQKQPLKVASLVKETAKLLRGSLPSTIEIKVDVRTETDTVLADPSQIQQVIMNLSTNAAHAMSEEGGTLTISLTDAAFSEEYTKPDREMQAGQYLVLAVRDTGTGMPKEIRDRIFDPFFTTKEPGQGTGMGLAVVYGIVKNHGGVVTVESSPGIGSLFKVFFPSHDEAASEERVRRGTLPGGNERLLVVDDEPSVVETASETLKRLGYRVTTAESGPEGWKTFEKAPQGFDLVITDHVMPEITGMRLAEKILEVRKDMPIILFTGYSETVSPEKAKEKGISEFLLKPVVARELAETVRRVLDGRAGG